MVKLNYSIWSMSMPTNILFGVGSFQQIVEVISRTKKNSILIVCGKSAERFGYLEKIFKKKIGDITVYDKISKDPTTKNIQEIVDLIQQNKTDLIIGLGGGSAIDAAKAASVIAPLEISVQDYFLGHKKITDKKITCIAIPTTAGTGAELSKGAIITWSEKNIKTGVRHDLVSPDIAIVDPELTLTVPEDQIKITGFDIFTHAVETYISKKCNPTVEHNSLQAIESIARYLPKAIENKTELKQRVELSYHSMMMGYNLANSSTCLPHRLQYPLGVLTGTEHAFGLAALYPAWVSMTKESSVEKFANISKALSNGMEIEDLGILNSLDVFMQKINLAPKLSSVGIDREKCTLMANMVEGALDNDPWWKSGEDLSKFYINSI